MDIEGSSGDICRVCRCESTSERPLFHPCICTGSIKYIHQECLTQWMKYSRKEFCELCGHHFSFTPIYSPDMPRRLPIKDLVSGLVRSIASVVECWFHYIIVAIAWLGVVPLSAYRIYRCFFTPSLESFLSLPGDLFSPNNIIIDILYGSFVVSCTLLSFIGLVWLREQILHGGGPDWLDRDNNAVPLQPAPPVGAAVAAVLEQEPDNIDMDQDELENQEIEQEVEEEDENDNEEGDEDEVADDNNWMPMEWERAAEELTWERLLGLDGSLLFIEHVFWIISLNALFILIFAMVPYQIGERIVSLFNINDWVIACHFQRLITIIIGYCHIGLTLVILYYIAAFFNFRKSKRFLGLGYVVVKVSVLSVVEIGLVPLICGWWLDICSLSMLGATLREREASFQHAPGTIMFIHWLVGMIYVYYFASFVLLTREVVRPGALWFLHNLNGPDFSPIQEMIHIPIIIHIRRLIVTTLIFGTNILLMVWLPIRILHYCWPSFLPYNFSQNFDQQTSELSLELLLLQIILPSLLEQSYTRVWLKSLIRHWCKAVAWILNLKSYILGDEDNNDTGTVQHVIDNNNGLGAFHQAMIHNREGPSGYQTYRRPKWFHVRLIGLIALLALSIVLISIIVLTLPVWIGRQLLKLYVVTMHTFIKKVFMIALPIKITETASGVQFHELYTTALGVYVCWLADRVLNWMIHWLPQGRAAITNILYQWLLISVKSFIVSILILGIIPLLFGLILEQIIIIPLRTPFHQTPLMFLWYDWALGLLYTKIACCIILMGPNWYLKAALERAYNNGFREMDFRVIMQDIIVPILTMFGLALCVPYVIVHSIVPIFIANSIITNWIRRLIYPILFLAGVGYLLISLEIRHFKRLYEHIKNDKYLVGRRLVNYNHVKNIK